MSTDDFQPIEPPAETPPGEARERESWLRFALIFGALAVASEMLFHGVTLDSQAFDAYLGGLARISARILDLLGQDVTVRGATIRNPRFAVQVAHGCDAVQICSMLAAAILAFPVPFARKLRGLVLGVLFLQLLNFARIVTLFLAGAYFPNAFESSHRVVWPTALIILTIGTWIFWVRWATRVEAEPLGESA